MLRLLERWSRRALIDYARPQPGKVAAQHADGSCEVQLDSSDYPILRNVPIYAGLPDSGVQVKVGARVLVEWAGGLPTSPLITAWGASQASQIVVGLSSTYGYQRAIRGEDYRTAETQMNSGVAAALERAATALGNAASDPFLGANAPAAALGLAQAALALANIPTGAAKMISDFETNAAAQGNLLTEIVRVG